MTSVGFTYGYAEGDPGGAEDCDSDFSRKCGRNPMNSHPSQTYGKMTE
jgi:hypothetical protein